MRLVKQTEMLGDSTSWLQAEEIPEGFTVEDAIRWIVCLNRDEFGRIYLDKSRGKEIATYHYREITCENVDTIVRFLSREVETIEANGAWGQMNYYITLK